MFVEFKIIREVIGIRQAQQGPLNSPFVFIFLSLFFKLIDKTDGVKNFENINYKTGDSQTFH